MFFGFGFVLLKRGMLIGKLFQKIKLYYSNFAICKVIMDVDVIVLSMQILGEKPRISWETSEGCIKSLAVKCT